MGEQLPENEGPEGKKASEEKIEEVKKRANELLDEVNELIDQIKKKD